MLSGTHSALLAATGSNVLPWLIGGGVVVVLGIIALVVGNIVRERRTVDAVADAAAGDVVDGADAADAAPTDAAPTAEPPASDAPDGETPGDSGSISPDDPR